MNCVMKYRVKNERRGRVDTGTRGKLMGG